MLRAFQRMGFAIMFSFFRQNQSANSIQSGSGGARRYLLISGLAAGLFLLSPAGIISSSGLPANAGGVISGEFAATSTGAATFNVPIQVPPGVQGLQPSLGLVYHSQNTSSSTTGVGWRLSGLPGIERCGKRRPLDARASAVKYTNEDRLCMDGVPLLPKQPIANDNDYWSQSGQTYGKELEDWSDIRPAHGGANGGPWELQATMPDGRIMYYGGHVGARILSANGNQKVRKWLLREIRDRNGNSIHYSYLHDWGHARVSRIDYAGRSIQFDYTKINVAQDQVIRSMGNEQMRIRQRLNRIRISTADNPSYKSYYLSYGTSNSSGRSRLERIEECDPNSCLEPLQLTWNDTPPLNGTFRKVRTPGYQYQLWLRSDHGVNIIPGDFNGDGKTDFIRQTKNAWDDVVQRGNFMVWFSNGDGTFNYVFPEDNGIYQDHLRYDPGARLITGDYNGDGKTDFIRMPRHNWGTFRVYFSRGDGYFDMAVTSNSAHQAWLRDSNANYYTGDFNGDGKTDFLRQEKGPWDDTVNWGNFLVFFSNGDGTFNHVNPGHGAVGDKFQDWLRADPGAHIIVGDYNGDGMSDFVRQEHSSWDDGTDNTFMVYLSNGHGGFTIVTPPERPTNPAKGEYPYQSLMRFDHGVNLIPGDFNGDGMTDLIRQEKGGWDDDKIASFQVFLSLGNGLFSVTTPNSYLFQDFLRYDLGRQIIPLDYNGDGRTDFISQPRATISDLYSGDIWVYVSRGDGYFDAKTLPGAPIDAPSTKGVHIITGDFDGDGRSDFIGQDHSARDDDLDNNFRVYFSSPTPNSAPIETIARIQQGTVSHDLSYRRLSEYAPNDGDPLQNFRYRRLEGASMAVLWKYRREVPTAVENGMAAQIINRTYDYKNPRMSTEGRGFLGFEKLTIDAPEEGERITERYGTAFPFSGRLLSRHTANYSTGQAISFVNHAWQGAGGSTNSSSLYAMQIARTERVNYADDGSSQLIKTEIRYDRWGSPNLVTDTDGGRVLQTCSEYNNSYSNGVGRPGPIARVVQGTGCTVSNNVCSCSTRLTETQNIYDSKANVIERKQYDSTRNAFLTTAHAYDSRGNRTRTTLPTGAVETISYESTYNTYPETITTTFNGTTLTRSQSYDARHGLPVDDVNENGALTRRSYDNFGRLASVHKTGPQGLVLVETHSYQRQGDVYADLIATRQAWDSASMTPSRDFRDGLGRVTQRQMGSGGDQTTIISIYNARDDLIQKSIPHRSGSNQGWTRYSYNSRHRVGAIQRPSGANSTLTYATGGLCGANRWRTTAVTAGGAGRNTLRCENARGKVEKIVMTDTSSGTSTTQTFTLDPLDRIVGVSDGQATTDFTIDSLGRRTAVSSSDRGTTEYFYDAEGQLARERRNGEDRTFALDALGRETRVSYHDGSVAEFEYDDAAFAGGKGQLTRAIMRAPGGVETSRREFSYDADGKAAVVHLALDGGAGGSHTMEYRHDPTGRPQSIQYPGGRIACYAYDGVGNLSEIQVATGDCADPQAEVFAAYSAYTAQGQPGRVVYGNGVTTDFMYDNLNRVATVKTLDSESVALLDQRYDWTPLHEVDQIEDLAGDNDVNYSYNGFGYLTRAVGPYGDIAYEYNPAGNLTKKGDLNISYSGSRPVSADNGLALSYDAHGNVTQRDRGDGNVFQFTYDGRYKIQQIAKNGVQAGRYEYDAFGDRVKKTDGNGTETIYVNRELEITRFAGGRLLTTEYIQGPTGRIAAISTGTDPVAMIHGTSATHALQAEMYNPASIAGLAGFLNHTAMSYIRNPSLAATGRALLWALLATAVIMAFAVYTIRTAHNRGWLGRLRSKLAHRLAEAAWLRNNAAMQTRLATLATGGEAAGAYHQRRRRLLRGPATILAVTMLSMTMQCGSSNGGSNITIAPPGSDLFAFNFLLGPGGNGYGYPEEGTFYFQYNQVGSTSLVTDSAGKQAAYTVYKPFGEIYQDASDGRDIFRGKFNNNEFDRDGDVHFFNARYYDASIGSFLQADRLTYGTNDYHAAGLNRYAFSGNNPVTYSDPGGNWFWIPLIIGAALVGGTVSAVVYTVTAVATGTFTWEGLGINFGIGLLAGALGGVVAGGVAAFATNLALRATWAITQSALQASSTILAPVLGAATESFVGSVVLQMIEKKGTVDWEQVGIDTAIGAASGGPIPGVGRIRSFGRTKPGSEVRMLTPDFDITYRPNPSATHYDFAGNAYDLSSSAIKKEIRNASGFGLLTFIAFEGEATLESWFGAN